MTKGKAAISIVVLVIATAAGVITIGDFFLDLWELFGSRTPTSVDRPVSLRRLALPVPSASPLTSSIPIPLVSPVLAPTPIPTPTPAATPTTTPVPPLGKQLEEALSVYYSTAQGKALRIVAEDAVLRNDYWTAIRAASATPSSSAQAENLAFVVACAIEDGSYDFAAEAADEVYTTTIGDRLKIDVIEARRRATSGATPVASEAMPSAADRESMACFK